VVRVIRVQEDFGRDIFGIEDDCGEFWVCEFMLTAGWLLRLRGWFTRAADGFWVANIRTERGFGGMEA
jgi:hypothetical protein